MKIISAFLSLILINLPVGLAFAEIPKLKQAAFYELYWGGLLVGEMVVSVNETDKEFHSKAQLEARGIARTISKFTSSVSNSGSVVNGKYIPQEYETTFRLRKKVKTIVLKLDKNGNVTSDEVNPPDNRAKRPAVETSLKQGVFDPMSTILESRKIVAERIKAGDKNFAIPLYDGRRRSELKFAILGDKIQEIREKKTSVTHVTLRREAIAGYTGNELERIAEEEPVIDIYLDPKELIPLMAVGTAGYGTAIAYLKHSCDTFEECTKFFVEE